MKKIASAPWTIAALLLAPLLASAEHRASVRYIDDKLDLERAADTSHVAASRNQPLEAGDRLTTSEDGRAEIVLPDGTLLWLDRDTRIDLVDLDPAPLLRVWRGAVALEQGAVEVQAEEHELTRIDARAGGFSLLEAGRYRVDVEREDELQVSVESGLGELRGRKSSVLVHGGERARLYDGEEPEDAFAYNTTRGDGFDRWIEERRGARDIHITYTDDELGLVPAVRPYRYELASHGSWRWYASFNRYVWCPTVSVGWRPWVDGYWSWYSDGLTWVSSEPWGYATYHYGVWDHSPGFGWFWVPGRTYGGAWVDWYVYDDWIGWCPPRRYSYYDHWGRSHHREVEVRRDFISRTGHHDRIVAVPRERLTGHLVRDTLIPADRIRATQPRLERQKLGREDLGLAPLPRRGEQPATRVNRPSSGVIRPERVNERTRPGERRGSTPWTRRVDDDERGRAARDVRREVRQGGAVEEARSERRVTREAPVERRREDTGRVFSSREERRSVREEAAPVRRESREAPSVRRESREERRSVREETAPVRRESREAPSVRRESREERPSRREAKPSTSIQERLRERFDGRRVERDRAPARESAPARVTPSRGEKRADPAPSARPSRGESSSKSRSESRGASSRGSRSEGRGKSRKD